MENVMMYIIKHCKFSVESLKELCNACFEAFDKVNEVIVMQVKDQAFHQKHLEKFYLCCALGYLTSNE